MPTRIIRRPDRLIEGGLHESQSEHRDPRSALEFLPRTGSNDAYSFRFPTELERRGDFSQFLHNLGNIYPFVRDPLKAGLCQAGVDPINQAPCFTTAAWSGASRRIGCMGRE